jgi:hypothetical protein
MRVRPSVVAAIAGPLGASYVRLAARPFQALVGHVLDTCRTLVTGTGEHLVHTLA